MTVIVDWQIRAASLDNPSPLISPFCERTVHGETGTSYGVSFCGYDIRIDQSILLDEDSQFLLASTVEQFHMPNYLNGVVHDKSSLIRRGLAVHNTVLEPGWRGFLTLEIKFHPTKDRRHLTLPAGAPIAQVMFHRLDARPEGLYTGKYQDQQRGPVEAKKEKPDEWRR